MEQISVPKYYGLRIYLFSTILYFFLAIPFLSFIALQNIPKFAEGKNFSSKDVQGLVDSLDVETDISKVLTEVKIDSIVNSAWKKTALF